MADKPAAWVVLQSGRATGLNQWFVAPRGDYDHADWCALVSSHRTRDAAIAAKYRLQATYLRAEAKKLTG